MIIGADIPVLIEMRSSGDHPFISSDATVVKQAAEMGLNWLDLTLFGTKAAFDALSKPEPCTGLMPGLWTAKSKNLEKLAR
jgi:hypothetical protein